MITLKPYGGLCNRIRSIDSLLAIVKPEKIPVRVIWENNSALYCNFNELFLLPDYVHITQKYFFPVAKISSARGVMKQIVREAGIKIPLGYKKYLFEKEVMQLKNNNYNFREILNYNSLYIESQNRFYSNGNDFEDFIPNAQIQSRVNKITGDFSSNTIGVHIRRTDNVRAIKNSPLCSFISEMKDALSKNNDTIFFLATDSSFVEETMSAIFSGRIIIQKNKKLSRKDPLAIQDALVDLLCLSKTKRMLGSYWSSFSDTAAAIGKIDLKIVNQVL